jgi:Spy/CpxP family protein refolding chaperone
LEVIMKVSRRAALLGGLSTFAALAMMTLPSRGIAQPPEGRLRDRARTFLVLRIADALNLSDEKAIRLSGVVRASEDQRRQLRQQRHEVEAKLRETLDKSPIDEAALGKLIAQANQIDQKLALLPEQGFKEMQKVLTTEEQAKLILLRPQLQSQVRRALQRRFQGAAERPGPSQHPQPPTPMEPPH